MKYTAIPILPVPVKAELDRLNNSNKLLRHVTILNYSAYVEQLQSGEKVIIYQLQVIHPEGYAAWCTRGKSIEEQLKEWGFCSSQLS